MEGELWEGLGVLKWVRRGPGCDRGRVWEGAGGSWAGFWEGAGGVLEGLWEGVLGGVVGLLGRGLGWGNPGGAREGLGGWWSW